MKVRHPQYGVGVIRSLTEHTAEIAFDDAPRTIAPASSDLQPAEATAAVSELQVPLASLIREAAHATVEALGLEKKDVVVEGLASRWQGETSAFNRRTLRSRRRTCRWKLSFTRS